MAYGHYKDLTRRTASDKILREWRETLAPQNKFVGNSIKNENMSDQQ